MQNWQTVSIPNISLNADFHTMQVILDFNGTNVGVPSNLVVNFNWFKINSDVNAAPAIIIPGNQVNTVGNTMSLQVVATDPNVADSLVYSATYLPV